MPQSYLSIGHCCHDKTSEGYLLGGTVSYSAILAKAWNKSSRILTSVGKDFQFFEKFHQLDIPIHNVAAAQTTIFENRYQSGIRTQYLRARGEVISVNNLLENSIQSSIVHFGPIANELGSDLLKAFPNSLTGLSIQGMLRQWNQEGLVSPKAMDWPLLKNVNMVFLSEEDIRGRAYFLEKIKEHCSHVVLTHGARGATVYKDGLESFFPAYPVNEIDPTGAGDTFTTAYLINFFENKEVESACIFAHCAASFVVEAEGLLRIPSIEEVKQRKENY